MGGVHGSKAGETGSDAHISHAGRSDRNRARQWQKQRANVSPQFPRFVVLEAMPVMCVAWETPENVRCVTLYFTIQSSSSCLSLLPRERLAALCASQALKINPHLLIRRDAGIVVRTGHVEDGENLF